jgi:D-glycero-beta-D-manno-heptose-7-phosphate kinase
MNQKILLIGDSCLDIFVYGNCYRLNPEAPTAVLSESRRIENPGMAGNVLKNIQVLGLNADFITNKENIIKLRYIDEKSNYILLRIDNDNFVEPIKYFESIEYDNYDMVIISDYNKGFMNEYHINYILKRSKISFIDTKKPIDDWIEPATFIKINEAEFNNPKNDNEFMFFKLTEKLIVTLGDKGVVYDEHTFSPPKEFLVRDVVGAGDTFLASVACHYMINKDIKEAIKFANLCAGQVVSKRGVAYPDEKLI